jgi:hypothetical protein
MTATTPADRTYRDFRNYLMNELGFGKDDIEAMLRQAVADQAIKMVGRYNFDKQIEAQVQAAINSLFRTPYGQPQAKIEALIRECIAAEITGKITLSIKAQEDTL